MTEGVIEIKKKTPFENSHLFPYAENDFLLILHQQCLLSETPIEEIEVEPSYTGPSLDKSTDEITSEWCCAAMQWMKDGNALHTKYVCMIIQKSIELFEQEETLVNIELEELEEITICGDIHG